MSDQCYICGNENEEILEQHHIVPRRFGGGDESENIVRVCPNCHSALERLYDKRFYDEIGAERESGREDVDRVCAHKECASTETHLIKNDGIEVPVCQTHKRCEREWCGRQDVTVIPTEELGARLVCDKHRKCSSGRCQSTDVTLIFEDIAGPRLLCDTHAAERGEA